MTRDLMALLFAALPLVALAGDVRPDGFAYGWQVGGATTPGAFHRLAVTREVRAAAVSPTLADLAVFDDDDRRMPSFLVEPTTEDAPEPAPVTIALFETVERLAAAAPAGQVLVQVEGGASVQAQVSVASEARTAVERRWYAMLDEPYDGQLWSAALAQWSPSGEPQIVSLELAVSDDLRDWRVVATGAVALLSAGPATLKRDRIALGTTLGRYLRVTALAAPEAWRLEGLALIPVGDAVEPEREWSEHALAGGQASLEVDLGAAMRIDRFELRLAPGAGLRRVELASAEAPTGPWTPRADTLFYSLERVGGPFESMPVRLPPTSARYWRVEVMGDGVGPLAARFGWVPTDLVFLAQGRAPYRVVAGLAKHEAASDLGDEARGLWRPDGNDPPHLMLGPRFELAGERARSPSFAADWKRWTLWALLALGVVAVLAMAAQLLREVRRA